jgi:hypothetical protein
LPESLPLIADPWFYAVAVPAVLITGISKSGFASGFGSLATPMIALTVTVPQAAAIMLPLLMVMDAAGLHQLWRSRDPRLVRLLVPAGLVGIALGALLFGLLPPKAVAGVLGAVTLLFLAQQLLMPIRGDGSGGREAPRWVGRLCAVASGFTSFIAHAGGPPISAYVLPLKLAPMTAAGTMAVFFAVINASKWLPYAWLGLIDLPTMATSLVLLPLAPVGVWVGVWLMKRTSPGWFYKLAYTGMGLTGVKLLWDAWR